MEPTNHPFRKENDLNQTSMLIFGGVSPLGRKEKRSNQRCLYNGIWIRSQEGNIYPKQPCLKGGDSKTSYKQPIIFGNPFVQAFPGYIWSK